MATDIKEAIRRLIYQYIVEGADKVMATQEAVAASTEKTDKASLSLEKSFGNLERRYIDTVRYQQDYQKVQERVNAAVAQNPALQERANAVLAAAGEHYDKLASRAGKSNMVVSFTAKAFSQLVGAAGLMGIAMEGVGVAASYVAEQFAKSRTTVAQAIEEQNRLMAEAIKLIDAKTSAQDRMFAQSKDETLFQSLRNELDLRNKLMDAQRKTAALGATKTSPMTGELGSEMAGLAPGPAVSGMAEITAAIEKMQAATAAGQSGLAAFNQEIGRIGRANPEVAQLADELLKAGQSDVGLQRKLLELQAIQDALNGVATNAQMAAAGLGSIAQFNMNNLKAQEAADALQRMAEQVDRLADKYPEISIEGAKQLELLDAQLEIVQARTREEELLAQEKARTLQLTLEGVDAEEAALRAGKERLLTEANWLKQQKENVYYSQNQGAATNEAYAAQSHLTDSAQGTAKALEEAASAADDTGNAVEDTGYAVARVAHYTQQIVVDLYAQEQAWYRNLSLVDKVDNRLRLMTTQFQGEKFELGGMGMDMLGTFYKQLAERGIPTGSSDYAKMVQDALKSSDLSPYIGMQDISSPAAASASLANVLRLGVQDGLGNVNRLIDAVTDKSTQASLVRQAIDYIQATQPASLAREEMINQLNDKLQGLIESTDSLNATMQNALSPFYSQDPRTTHLGFRAGVVGNPEWMVGGASNENPLAAILGPGATAPGMATGGSFVVGGGYSANDNRIAAFPVASGEEVIVNRNRKGAEGGQVIHIDNRTIINGRVDADVFAQMKVSKYQQTQRMRAGLAVA